MGSIMWEQDVAEIYDETYAAMNAPEVLGPMVDLLTTLTGDGRALELAVGTGHVALALSAARRRRAGHRALASHGSRSCVRSRGRTRCRSRSAT